MPKIQKKPVAHKLKKKARQKKEQRNGSSPKILTYGAPSVQGDPLVCAEGNFGQYFVAWPAAPDVPRLRTLECEFVDDHRQLYKDTPWFAKVPEQSWFGLVSVHHRDKDGLPAIGDIVAGRRAAHISLSCAWVRPAGAIEVVGYLHAYINEQHVEVAHLMVSHGHRGRGLGALLLMGLICHFHRDCPVSGASSVIKELSLSVLEANQSAIHLYKQLGFEEHSREPQEVSNQCAVTWTRMKRIDPQSTRTKEVFKQYCLKRLTQ